MHWPRDSAAHGAAEGSQGTLCSRPARMQCVLGNQRAAALTRLSHHIPTRTSQPSAHSSLVNAGYGRGIAPARRQCL